MTTEGAHRRGGAYERLLRLVDDRTAVCTIPSAMASARTPLSRTMPIPPSPAGVAIAQMVSSSAPLIMSAISHLAGSIMNGRLAYSLSVSTCCPMVSILLVSQ